MGDFPPFYAIFMIFHEHPQFSVNFTEKGGITWKSANFHDFLDFRRSGAAKALEFAWIIKDLAGSAAGVADLELMVKYSKKPNFHEDSWKTIISWNFMKFGKFPWKLWFRAPPRALIPETVWITALFCMCWRPGFVEFHTFSSFSLKFMIFHDFMKKAGIPSFFGISMKNTFSAHARLADTWETTTNIKGSGQVGVEVMKIYHFTDFH